MIRECSRCGTAFQPRDLDRDESRQMEAERKALGVHGVLFRCYTCAACGCVDIFVDLLPVDGENDEEFGRRRQELERTVHELRPTERADVILIEKGPGFFIRWSGTAAESQPTAVSD